MRISHERLTAVNRSESDSRGVVDASDLGIVPGFFPKSITVEFPDESIEVFRQTKTNRDADNDVTFVSYVSINQAGTATRLDVFND